jgi:hypothetical protein
MQRGRTLIILGALVFIGIVAVLSIGSFASTSTTSTVSISAGGLASVRNNFADVQSAGGAGLSASAPYLKHGVYTQRSVAKFTPPAWSPTVNSVGSISTPGDLYYINASGTQGNVLVSLFLTNPDKLSVNYTYLNMQVNVYVKGSKYVAPTALVVGVNDWEQASLVGGSLIGNVYLNLTNGFVSFLLPGNKEYVVTIDSGTFYSINNDTSTGALSPTFNATVTAA